MAPYFVQMREAERRLIQSTLDVARQTLDVTAGHSDHLEMAAGLLGVHITYLRVRGRVLGGVFEGEPKLEPPTLSATEVWANETSGSKTKKAKADA